MFMFILMFSVFYVHVCEFLVPCVDVVDTFCNCIYVSVCRYFVWMFFIMFYIDVYV